MTSLNSSLYVPGLFNNTPTAPSRTSHRTNSSTASRKDFSSHDRPAGETLRFVLANANSARDFSPHDRGLIESFRSASSSDKAFVTSIADCSKQLQKWCKELEGWKWNGSFDDERGLDTEQSTKNTNGKEDSGVSVLADHIPTAATITDLGDYGGHSSSQLSTYGERLQAIRSDLESMDMEEMKHRALTTQLLHGNEMGFGASSAEYQDPSLHSRVDVLSALVTVTLLEALPNYTKATTLTQAWAARVAVLELVPSFSVKVEQTKGALDNAWASIEDKAVSLSDVRFEQLRNDLEDKVGSLGQTIDFMLDTLEGLEDTLPEKWVDIVEALEVDYSAWTVAARKFLLKYLEDDNSRQEITRSPTLEPNHEILAENDHRVNQPEQSTAAMHPSNPASNKMDSVILDNNEDNKTKVRDFQPTQDDASMSTTHSDLPTFSFPSHADQSDRSSPKLTTHKSLDLLPAGFSYEGSATWDSGLLKSSIHSRGPSVESVDSEIANPDGSYRELVAKRVSMYRTASATVIGTVTSSQIRSVDLGHHPNGLPLLPRELSQLQGKDPDPFYTPVQKSQEFAASHSLIDPSILRDNTKAEQPQPPSSGPSAEDSSSEISSSIHFAQSTSPRATEDRPKKENEADESEVDWSNESSTSPIYDPDNVEVTPKQTPRSSFVTSDSPNKEIDAPSSSQDFNVTPERQARFSIQPISTDEQLERRIDRILTTIPARINFNRTTYSRSQKYQTPDKTRSATPGSDRSPTPSLTLAPAEQRETRAARSSGDSAIKVYHLYQEGRQQPIKLYVRLVGENGERVMVRVGGGWADLGEYLREYASHHSRTVVPEPNAPLQAVDLQQPSNTRVFSLPLITNEPGSPSPTPPESPTDGNKWSGPQKPRVAAVPADTLKVPPSRARRVKSVQETKSFQDMSSEEAKGEDGSELVVVEDPQEADDDDDDNEDDDDDDDPAPGMLSPEKKKWLDAMVSKAKKWKAEGGVSSQGGKGASTWGLQDMGSVGATKRVYRVSDASFKGSARQ